MKKKLIKGFGLIVIINMLGGIILFMQFNQFDKKIKHIETELNLILNMSEKLSANINKIQIKLYRIKSRENIYVDTLINYVEEFDNAINVLKNLNDIKPKIDTVNNIAITLESLKSTISRIITTTDEDILKKLNRIALEKSLKMNEYIDDLRVYVNSHSIEERREAFMFIKYYSFIFIATLFLIIIISIFIVRTTMVEVTKPIEMLVRSTREISKGNLKYRINLNRGIDEVVELSMAFDSMAAVLENIEDKKTEVIKQLMVTIDDRIKNKLAGVISSVEVILSDPKNIPGDVINVLEQVKKSAIEINVIISKLSNAKKVITADYIQDIKMLDVDK